LSVDQIDNFAQQAGLANFINGAGRIALRFVGRESVRLLLREDLPQTVEHARKEAGFDGPVGTILKGWSLSVAERPFTVNDYTIDTGVRLIAGMRKNLGRKLVRVPLDLGISTWIHGGFNMQIGQRQFDAPDTIYADQDNELLTIGNRFLNLVANS
jgi:hypothetical protein